jgi:protein SCO1
MAWTIEGVARLLAAAAFVVLSTHLAEARRWGREYLPNVPVVTQDGQTLNFYDDVIKGKVVIVNFIYTTCADVCPLTSARLAQAQERFGDKMGKDIFFVSVSIDPETDTPARLKAQADALRAGPGWLFLTGKRAHIDEIRYKLGERSRSLSDHRNEVLLGNDRIGRWGRESVFGDLDRFVITVRQLDPSLSDARAAQASAELSGVLADIGGTAEPLFRRACAACHTVGQGDKVGPDLAGISERRDRAWLLEFIQSPELMRRKKDPLALELMAQRPSIRMPNLGLSRTDTEDLLSYIDEVTRRERLDSARVVQDVPSEFPLQSLHGLVTHEGVKLDAGAMIGDHVIGVVFGFTNCPDICPTTLLDWSNLLESMGEQASKLKLYFVSVDSERDTPEVLKTYLQSFDPRITALTGSAEQIARAAQAFDAHYEKVENGSDYVYDHTIKTFLLDRTGRRAGGVDLNTVQLDRRRLLANLLR